MKITLDRAQCMGHGQCELFAPGVFKIGDDDIVEQVRAIDASDPADLEAVRIAAQNCPERAITVEE
jgi:ferredoxin